MSILDKKPRRRMPRPAVPTGPVSGLMDPRFAYVSHLSTDIRKTFKRVRAQLAQGRLP